LSAPKSTSKHSINCSRQNSLAFGAGVRGKDVLPLLSGDLHPEMVEALRRVKTKFRTGCITNNLPANAIGSLGGRSLYVAEVMALFDYVIESVKIGLRKPDPRIYRMMIEALGVDPKNCVYLDDLGVNLKPARDMGKTTIKVLNAPPGDRRTGSRDGLVASIVVRLDFATGTPQQPRPAVAAASRQRNRWWLEPRGPGR
jgi:putative hydrolase of the HAD superfamily